jgi:dihydrofolate synthase/folylpolyglutamate synthase
MQPSTLEEWLQRLEGAHFKAIDLGLARSKSVFERLGLQPNAKIVTVAGTNGKGSTVATIDAILRAQGLRTGVFTSPHLRDFNERIHVHGAPCSDAELIDAFEKIESARAEISLTYYETSCLAAALIFHAAKLDVWVLEVGLGGRLDTVNIFDADVAVITSIDLDHQEYLGDTRELIAVEKAGIARAGRPCVIAEKDPPSSLISTVEACKAKPLLIGRDFFVDESALAWSGRWATMTGECELSDIPSSGLMPSNMAAAVAAVLQLNVDMDLQTLRSVLSGLSLAGRREIALVQQRYFLFDVAHNPAAVGSLMDHVHNRFPHRGLRVLFSAMLDKDCDAMLAAAAEWIPQWYIADQSMNPRAASASHLMGLLSSHSGATGRAFATLEAACDAMIADSHADDLLIVMGSFTTVGAIRAHLGLGCASQVNRLC